MPEFEHIRCKVHPSECITNYCARGLFSIIQMVVSSSYAPPVSALTPRSTS